jgi:PAS domain S-box-containing protein
MTDRKLGAPPSQPPPVSDWRRQEGRLRLFVGAVKDYAIFILDPQGNVASWNEGARRLKGYSAAEIIGLHFSRFFSEEDVRAGKPQRELETAAREGRTEDEGWRVRKDGSRFWANVVLTATRDEKGQLLGFVKVTRDFAERMRAHEALEKANAKLAAEVAERKLAEKRQATSERSLRELSLPLLRTQDEERKRIGRDLHDSLGQYLAVLKISLESLTPVLNDHNPPASDQLKRCITLAD